MPGVIVSLGLRILRFLELEILTLTSTVSLGFLVRTTPTVCRSSLGVKLFDLEVSVASFNSMIFSPPFSSSSFGS